MNDKAVVNRTIRCYHRGLRANYVSVRGFNLHLVAIFNFYDASLGENTTTKIDNLLRQRIQILQGMKLRLSWNSQDTIGIKLPNRNPVDEFDTEQTCAKNRFQFALQICNRPARRQKQIAVHSLEVAVDLLPVDDRFDPIDRRHLALRAQARTLLTQHFFDLVVTVIHEGDKLGSGSASHSPADRT